MSVESAKAFMEKVKSDETFKSRLDSLGPEDRTQFIKGAGFDFSDEELAACTGELDDDLLDQVAGGGSSCNEDCGVLGNSCTTQCGSDANKHKTGGGGIGDLFGA